MAKTSQASSSKTSLSLTGLLWPHGKAPTTGTLQSGESTQWTQDLRLDAVVQAFGAAQRHTSFIRQTLASLVTDPDTIAWRQAILRDFLANPPLVERLNALVGNLANLRIGHPQLGKYQRNVLLDTADRLAELGLYVEAVQELYLAIQDVTLQSEGLLTLRENLKDLVKAEQFRNLKSSLPELQRPLQTFASLTVGINLDSQLRPASAVLLAVNEQRFGGIRSFLGKLFALDKLEDEALGVAPLHQVPSDPEIRPLSPLFRDLDRLIAQSVQPITRVLTQFAQVSIGPVADLENEIAFYVATARLITRMESQGIAFCQPEIALVEDRLTHIEGLVNLHLALRENSTQPIDNDVDLDEQGRIAILTGPNSGGKTTYIQAVGLAQVFFQAGLWIPAHAARMSPVDAILTHFPALESFQGRFSEEAARLRVLCLKATERSLVLLNESLSSTTASEGFYVAQELLGGLRFIGVRGIFATHLIELAERTAEIEAAIGGKSAIYSLVAGLQLVEDPAGGEIRAAPTYHITRGLPQGRGYAREIARRYGISLEQIVQARQETDSSHDARSGRGD